MEDSKGQREHTGDPNSEIATGKYGSRHTKWSLSSLEKDTLISSTVLKLLLFPAYRSTDFEVHRNWLAITHSLPWHAWYYEENVKATSEWTLDYPPFFAYFEWILSIPAAFVDSGMVDIRNLNYAAWSTIVYQRSTVILFEFLALGTVLLRFNSVVPGLVSQRIIAASIFTHPGLLIVDHIHFQYNGFLFGILLWSIFYAQKGEMLMSGVIFAILLNFKHIYMYLAPAYFVYLLRAYCMTPEGSFLPKNFARLGSAITLIFAASLGPFILKNQLPQLLSRLFPFNRGLNHTYWAPNMWALVTALDRAMIFGAKRLGLPLMMNLSGVASSSRGLVGDTVFGVLPEIKPVHTFIATISVQSIVLLRLWKRPSYRSFLVALILSAYVSFLFGWHVHEKAVLLILMPLSLVATESQEHFRIFLICSSAGILSLFPLIFTPTEELVVVMYSALWAVLVFRSLRRYTPPRIAPSSTASLVERAEQLYLWGIPLVRLGTWVLPLLLRLCGMGRSKREGPVYEFLPLMLTSLYCAVGMCWAFLRLFFMYVLYY